MRIAIIAPPWLPVPPPAYGGTELVLDLLARGLRDRGHDVLLYTTGDVERVADLDGLDRRACRAAAQARFSASRMVTEHLEVYEQVMDRAAGEQAA